MCFLFVKIFCCYVYFVSKETRKHAVLRACEYCFGDNYPTVPLVTGSLRNSVQKCGKILRGETIPSPPWFQHCGGERRRRSDASGGTSGDGDTDAATMLMLQRQEGKLLNAKKAFKVTVVRCHLHATQYAHNRDALTPADNVALPAFASRCSAAAAIDRYLLPAGPAAANPPQRRAAA